MAAVAAATAIGKIERAHQMYREGLHLEALGFYTEALAMAKTKAQRIALHSNRAACYLKLQDFRKAAEECTSVLELDHQHTGALMLRAQTLVTLKEYQSALFDVNRLMELNPSSDVYRNLQARLRTQLALAPIPESEEESLAEEEDSDDEHEQDSSIQENVDLKIEYPGPKTGHEEAQVLKVAQEVDKKIEPPRYRTGSEMVQPNVEDGAKNKISTEVAMIQQNSEGGVKNKIKIEVVTVQQNLEDNVVNKSNVSTGKKEVPAVQRKKAEESADVHTKGWEAIPKPKGHSGLDYSRWDRVEDDSSEDEDEEEEEQPHYRFRVRTVGVRPVK